MQKIDLSYVQLGSSASARDINREVILEVIRAHQPVSRAHLARLSGLQRSTVSLIVNQLIEEGWIREGVLAALPRGRRPTMIALNDNLVMLAADIRPRFATVAVVDLNGCVLARTQLPVTFDPESTLAAIIESMRGMQASYPERSFLGVGISLPGRVDTKTKCLRFAPNLGWASCDIQGMLGAGTGLPVELDNAANACMLAEMWFGSMDGVRNAVLVTIAEGIDAGILANGQLLHGDHGMAGEFGHIPLDPNGQLCGCGAYGCWEMYASSNAALRYYATTKPKKPAGTIEELLHLAGDGDRKAIAALTRQAQAIGRGLRLVSATLAPELILLAGDIVDAWERFGPIIEQAFHEVELAGFTPRLMPARQADVARLRGAAILVLQRLPILRAQAGKSRAQIES